MKRVPAKFPQQTLLLVWLHSADPRGFPRRPSQDSGWGPPAWRDPVRDRFASPDLAAVEHAHQDPNDVFDVALNHKLASFDW